MPDNPVAPAAPGTPAEPEPTEDFAAKAVELERQLADYKTREGRLRNEVGVLRSRTRELEHLAFNPDGTPQMPTADPNYTPAPYGYTQPQAALPPNVVSREEFDVWRFQSQPGVDPATFDKVRSIAQDPGQIGRYIRYMPDPRTGLATPSVFDTYSAIYDTIRREAESKELADLRAKQSPQRNPSLATISGTGASSISEDIDLSKMTPEEMKVKFPDMFADWSGTR